MSGSEVKAGFKPETYWSVNKPRDQIPLDAGDGNPAADRSETHTHTNLTVSGLRLTTSMLGNQSVDLKSLNLQECWYVDLFIF